MLSFLTGYRYGIKTLSKAPFVFPNFEPLSDFPCSYMQLASLFAFYFLRISAGGWVWRYLYFRWQFRVEI